MKRIVGVVIFMTIFIPAYYGYAAKLALVIGNANYKESPLSNTINDAHDMAAILKTFEFEVIVKTNVDKQTMKESVREFGRRLKNEGGVGLFYFSGHGLSTTIQTI